MVTEHAATPTEQVAILSVPKLRRKEALELGRINGGVYKLMHGRQHFDLETSGRHKQETGSIPKTLHGAWFSVAFGERS